MEVSCCRAAAIYKTWLAIKEGERLWVGPVKSASLVEQLHLPLPQLYSTVHGAHSYSQMIFPHQTQVVILLHKEKNPSACSARVPALQHSCSRQEAHLELVRSRQRGKQEVPGQGEARCWLLRLAEAAPAQRQPWHSLLIAKWRREIQELPVCGGQVNLLNGSSY